MAKKHYLKVTKEDCFTSKADGKKPRADYEEISQEDTNNLGKYYEKIMKSLTRKKDFIKKEKFLRK